MNTNARRHGSIAATWSMLAVLVLGQELADLLPFGRVGRVAAAVEAEEPRQCAARHGTPG